MSAREGGAQGNVALVVMILLAAARGAVAQRPLWYYGNVRLHLGVSRIFSIENCVRGRYRIQVSDSLTLFARKPNL